MTVIDIPFRVDEICKKYDKYDIEKQREQNAYGDDQFARLYGTFESEIDSAFEKSERAAFEQNRAVSVALNAEIRRTKARLVAELPKLQKLAHKKVKGLSKDDLIARGDLVLALQERIESIPDGTSGGAKQSAGGLSTSAPNNNHIKFDSSDGNFDADYFQQSEESGAFRREYEMHRMKQDEGLDVISEGLEQLKDLTHDMNEELDRQVPLMDEMEMKVDRATSELKNTNVRLKETLFKVRSTRNFLIDIILLCIILGTVSSDATRRQPKFFIPTLATKDGAFKSIIPFRHGCVMCQASYYPPQGHAADPIKFAALPW
ncbi:hypothetical protein MLD38_004013 [Melastoma candidum]|uniref:Uncharacterized protein n=1 Tax=Melastoma candidum TaxID=119954 RepID=A0ACB9S3L3_9MYRT|nr:hypothetical protein MLD38_004013 [Melastoma candidum]